MTGKFSGKTVLVTGGSRGIGRACVLAFAANGADVAVNYHRNEEEASKTKTQVEDLGRKSAIFRADTSQSSEVKEMVRSVVEEFGKIDILVNNAGVIKRTPFLEISEEEWDWTIDVNLKGYFLVGQAVAAHMVKQKIKGNIVNMSSNSQVRAALNIAHYDVSKAGVGMLTKCMALELAPYGIRVNAVAPGLTETDMNRMDIANKEFREGRLARIPLKVIGKPEDLTAGVLFLASDDSKLSTGHTIFLDGGSIIS